MELQGKPDFEPAMKRIYAWFDQQIIDRPPVRFSEHNSDFAGSHTLAGRKWPDLKSRWFDAEFQVDYFLESIRGKTFYGETFPIFSPNLGPNVYAAFYGADLDFGEVTSWIRHSVREWDDMHRLKFSRENEYFFKIEELTRVALEKSPGRFMVGYTDLHGSLDCAADWRDPQLLCLDIFDCPDNIHQLVRLANENFLPLFDHYDATLKRRGQLSVNWMGIPSYEKIHIPSCDFTANVSTENFEQFYLPSLLAEVRSMTHNIFHLDGKGMIRHLDRIVSAGKGHEGSVPGECRGTESAQQSRAGTFPAMVPRARRPDVALGGAHGGQPATVGTERDMGRSRGKTERDGARGGIPYYRPSVPRFASCHDPMAIRAHRQRTRSRHARRSRQLHSTGQLAFQRNEPARDLKIDHDQAPVGAHHYGFVAGAIKTKRAGLESLGQCHGPAGTQREPGPGYSADGVGVRF
jgi:hypothetical protein